MSVSSAQSSLNQIEAEIRREEKKKSDAEVKVTRISKQISDKEAEISRTTSVSAKQSKQNQIRQWTNDLNRARKDASDAGTKLVGLYERRRKAEQTLADEQKRESDRETQQLRRQVSELTAELQAQVPPVREPNMIMQCVRPLIERYPDALALFDRAAEKYEAGSNDRNALDDMRLCFELVLKSIFGNDKSLENQLDGIGRIMKGAGLSPEFRSTFRSLVDLYGKYQDHHVKHNESINPYEVTFMIEFTCILMKQMIEQFGQESDRFEEE